MIKELIFSSSSLKISYLCRKNYEQFMIKNSLISLVMVFILWSFSSGKNGNEQEIFSDFKQLLVDIRLQKNTPDEAKQLFQEIMQRLHWRYPHLQKDSADVQLVFPLKGKNYRAVGGNGSGFRRRGFDLFDHSKQGSHPAHDIFIYDRNQDSIEDNTGNYVDVLAVTNGIIIANETEWQEGSLFRGGNFIWLYDFQTGGLWYYAHQHEVYVYPGQLVSAGNKIGIVGRTGFNAAAKRSDTHLHLMFLDIDEEFLPRPINHYLWLKNAQTSYEATFSSFRPKPTPLIINKLKGKTVQLLPSNQTAFPRIQNAKNKSRN